MTSKKSIDTIMLGPEPQPSGPFYHEKDIRLSKFFNWYNYFHNVADGRVWIVKWMQSNNYSKQVISAFSKVPDTKISMTICSLSRMANNGAEFNDVLRNKIESHINTCVSLIKPTKKQETTVSVIDRTREKAGDIIADLDSKLDDFYRNKYVASDFSMYDYLRKDQVKKIYGKFIIDYFKPLLDEIELAISKKDKDCVEAYSRLSKKQLTSYQAFVKMLLSDSERYFNNQTTVAAKKPRVAKKPIATPKVNIAGLKYLKEFNELKIVSCQPVAILDTSSLWIYNVKTKKLSVLYAEENKKLSIKGTSIINYDESKSISKTVRKPEEVLQQVLTGSKPSLKKIMSLLNTKESPASGRSNEETILLRCVK